MNSPESDLATARGVGATAVQRQGYELEEAPPTQEAIVQGYERGANPGIAQH